MTYPEQPTKLTEPLERGVADEPERHAPTAEPDGRRRQPDDSNAASVGAAARKGSREALRELGRQGGRKRAEIERARKTRHASAVAL
jgi:hypothetical protein